MNEEALVSALRDLTSVTRRISEAVGELSLESALKKDQLTALNLRLTGRLTPESARMRAVFRRNLDSVLNDAK